GARWASRILLGEQVTEVSSLQPGTFRLQVLGARWARRGSLGEHRADLYLFIGSNTTFYTFL
ncbi:hypothetical protein A2U01_0106412, partial [Trifolium medium]|nr:hypothetical protein [Trifolium medium]